MLGLAAEFPGFEDSTEVGFEALDEGRIANRFCDPSFK